MDDISPLIALPFKVGNGESVFATCVDVAGIELIANTRSLFCKPSMTKLPTAACALESKNSSSGVSQDGVVIKVESSFNRSSVCEDNALARASQCESCLMYNDASGRELKEDRDPMTLSTGALACIQNASNLRSGRNGLCTEENVVLETSHGQTMCNDVHTTNSVSNESLDLRAPIITSEIVNDLFSLAITDEVVSDGEPKKTLSTSLLEEKKVDKQVFHNVAPPLWGLISVRGRRLEMEDSVIALPHFLQVPSWMLNDNPHFSSMHDDLTAHVFGVYDGHGGCQVANYCQERLHVALAEEIATANDHLQCDHNLEDRWLMAFQKCFRRLDDEVGGFPLDNGGIISDPQHPQPIAPDSVGSTAVVAIVCSTHIIVGNCGDSRAVLYRGKVPIPLSVDHKPGREDECARIEAAGGKVIRWDGYRVSGVLAVSRSIGDRYLRPYVVPDPEVMLVPRRKEDECLVLASDGLWDVMTNNEACELARKRILLWHKKFGTTLPKERGEGIDPAAQEAADFLSKVAFQRGSTDNISIVVVDLKWQRKFKKPTQGL